MKGKVGLGLLAAAACGWTAAGADFKYPELHALTKRMERGESVTVAYFGGSITWGATASDPLKTSWRALVTEGLVTRFPKARIKAVDAAIGGQPSRLGVFRMDRDVLPAKPDLCFVEFAVNDWDAPDSGETVEGIVRKLQACRRDMAIVPVFIGSNAAYDRSPAQDRHQAVADHYGLPVVDIFTNVKARVAAGLKTEAFLTDTCHPNDAGYRMYADIVLAELARQAVEPGKPAKPPAGPLTSNRYERACMVELAILPDLGGWKAEAPSITGTWFDQQPSRWFSSAVVPKMDGAVLALELPCTGLGLYYEISEGGGPIFLAADGTTVQEIPTTQTLPFARVMYTFTMFEGPAKRRTVTLTAPRAAKTKAAYVLCTR